MIQVAMQLAWGLAQFSCIVAGFGFVAWMGSRDREPRYYLAGVLILLGYAFHGACIAWPMLRFWKNVHP